MAKKLPENLFILEIANNHMGDVEHGIHLIQTFAHVCKKYPFNFGFKLQYRALDSFIHPAMKDRHELKYIKRFSETKLSRSEFDKLIAEVRNQGFLTICTPFDNESVDVIESQNLDIIKIASCSFTDWSLLERIVQNDKPIIASTAGAQIEEIDHVVSYFSHRNKEFAIMHCVAQYPTPDENIHLSQIRYLKQRYPKIPIGFSTHENPSDTKFVSMAFAMGATIFERHVGIPTEKYNINDYSSTPEQIDAWLSTALYSKKICGYENERPPLNTKEIENLRSLRRGVYSKKQINKGELIKDDDIYFAFPPESNQLTANDWSKYHQYEATKNISKDEAIKINNSKYQDTREKIWLILEDVKDFLKKSQCVIPKVADLEISYHYGIEKFNQFGLFMMIVVNRNYCKKLLVILPGQSHPEQHHIKKEETFHVLYGEIELQLNGKSCTCVTGDIITILPKVRHAFSSKIGAVIEEISTTHYQDDSYYTDPVIMKNKQRKTQLTHWME